MVKKHIVLRKRPNPVRVTLPNGRYFTSRWERLSRKQLPINIKVTRNRTIGPRRNSRGIYFNLTRPALNRIRQRRKQEKRRLAVINQLYPDMTSQIGSGMDSDILKAILNLGSKGLGSKFGKKTN